MKRTIVIVDCFSTGFNYVDDIRSRGYEPVVVESTFVCTQEERIEFEKERQIVYSHLPKDIRIVKTCPYPVLRETIRQLDPVLVIPGSEFGVELATHLSEDLGLIGNPTANLAKYTQKDAMHQALKDHGIRYIRSRVVHSEEEACAFYEELGSEHIVVKRLRGAGSQGLYLCEGKEEMLHAVRKALADSKELEKRSGEVLLQERIFGTEYIVNTLSCKGKHRMVSMWKYEKMKLSNGTNAYDNAQTVNQLDVEHLRLIRYAFDVLDAIGLVYGPVHGEYMVDEKGPVLIEVNCRPMGAGMPREFVDLIFGHHETDVALDSYLDPDKFDADRRKPYRPLRKGAIKLFIVNETSRMQTAPVLPLVKHLKSYFTSKFYMVGRSEFLSRTKDLETAGGTVYLVHDHEQTVLEDCRLLHKLEMYYFHMLYHDGRTDADLPSTTIPDMTVLLKETDCHGSTLIFSDSPVPEEIPAVVTDSESLKDCYDGFDQGILNLSCSETFADMESLLQQIFLFFEKIRSGGRIIVPESTYCHLPYDMEGMVILMKAAGLRIEIPIAGMIPVIIASAE